MPIDDTLQGRSIQNDKKTSWETIRRRMETNNAGKHANYEHVMSPKTKTQHTTPRRKGVFFSWTKLKHHTVKFQFSKHSPPLQQPHADDDEERKNNQRIKKFLVVFFPLKSSYRCGECNRCLCQPDFTYCQGEGKTAQQTVKQTVPTFDHLFPPKLKKKEKKRRVCRGRRPNLRKYASHPALRTVPNENRKLRGL